MRAFHTTVYYDFNIKMNEFSKTVVTLLHLIFCHARVHCSNLSDIANLKRDCDSVYVSFVVVHCKEIEIIHRLILVIAMYCQTSLLAGWEGSKFRANIYLIRTTSNYFWASEVFKNQSLKVTYFHFPSTKNFPNWKHELIFMQL